MHKILKLTSEILPLTWGVEAVRNIANKGATFTDKIVLKGFYTTVIWILVFILVTFYHVKYKRNSLVSRS